jgi:hypothetical protein
MRNLLSVDLSAMAHSLNGYDSCGVVNPVDDSIVPAPNAPGSFFVSHFLATSKTSVVPKRQHSLFNFFEEGGRNRFKFFLGAGQDDYSVAHLRLRRISASASSKGIGTSPEAFRSSHARRSSRSSSASRIFSYSSTLIITAIFSPRSLTTNWWPFPVESFMGAVYSRVDREGNGNKLRFAGA